MLPEGDQMSTPTDTIAAMSAANRLEFEQHVRDGMTPMCPIHLVPVEIKKQTGSSGASLKYYRCPKKGCGIGGSVKTSAALSLWLLLRNRAFGLAASSITSITIAGALAWWSGNLHWKSPPKSAPPPQHVETNASDFLDKTRPLIERCDLIIGAAHATHDVLEKRINVSNTNDKEQGGAAVQVMENAAFSDTIKSIDGLGRAGTKSVEELEKDLVLFLKSEPTTDRKAIDDLEAAFGQFKTLSSQSQVGTASGIVMYENYARNVRDKAVQLRQMIIALEKAH